MLDRERACKKVGPSVAILDPVHDAKGADSQVRTVAEGQKGEAFPADVGAHLSHFIAGILITSYSLLSLRSIRRGLSPLAATTALAWLVVRVVERGLSRWITHTACRQVSPPRHARD